MGRKSSLTENQWAEIERRSVAGESGRKLAAEFGISEAAIRKRLGSQVKEIKDVAKQLVAAEMAFKALPIGAQISARTLADELIEITSHLVGAGKYTSSISHRLSAIANSQLDKIDEQDPMKSAEVLQSIAVLTKMANSSAEIGIGLLTANKEMIRDAQRAGGKSTADALLELADRLPN